MAKRLKQYKLAAAIYMSCQGRIFIYSGEEFLRTKNGEHNTFNMPIELNRIDWKLAEENKDMVEYYKALIKLRKELTGLCDKDSDAGKNIETFIKNKGLLGVKVVNKTIETTEPLYKEAVIIFNANDEAIKVKLPEGEYKILLDSDSFGKGAYDEVLTGEIEVQGSSAVFLGKK